MEDEEIIREIEDIALRIAKKRKYEIAGTTYVDFDSDFWSAVYETTLSYPRPEREQLQEYLRNMDDEEEDRIVQNVYANIG
ncbi:MAG: hypothetical protein RBT32_08035 [Methanothermobacter sp.]|jgi:hypothetical protein|nr:hypothetical protein [Methanothermobacter sp.]